MLKVELKRILKTRSTWWLFGIAFVLCIFMAVLTVNYASCTYLDESGNEQVLRGADAIAAKRALYEPVEGEMSSEKIEEAISLLRALTEEYGEVIPGPIYFEKIIPLAPVLNAVQNTYSMWAGEISPERAAAFYDERRILLLEILEKKYPDEPQILSHVEESLANTEEPFIYTYGIGDSDALEFLTTCALLLTLICVVLTAPIFSSDYASGSDDILRCTKRGRNNLALTKLGSALLISLCIFLLCVGGFLIITYSAYGHDITSAEWMGMRWNPNSLTAMGCLGTIFMSSLLSFLAMTCFALFLSSKLKNSLTVLAIAAAVVMIPTFMSITGIGWNVMNWAKCCLPSGGLGLGSNIFYALFFNLDFLWIGDFVTWSPYVMLVAAAVQIPIWFGLTVRSYNKHEAA